MTCDAEYHGVSCQLAYGHHGHHHATTNDNTDTAHEWVW